MLGGESGFLYTMNSDGTDPRILAGWKEGGRVAWPVPVRLPADVEACSKGVVVPNPEENPGLVEDCRTLLEMRDQLAGSGTHAWSSDRGISGWPGVGVSGQPPRVRALYPVFPILGVFRLKGQPRRDGSIIVRSCKATQSPVYPIRDAILAVNHASCPSFSSSCPLPVG